MKKAKDKFTILSAMSSVIDILHYVDDVEDLDFYVLTDERLRMVKDECNYLSECMKVSPRQAALFTIILEISQGETISKRDLACALKANFMQVLSYETEFQALENAKLIERCHKGRIRVNDDALTCFEKNKPYKKPSIENLTSLSVLSRMSSIMRKMRMSDSDSVSVLKMIDEMILANPHTSIADAAHKYHILEKGASVIEDCYQEPMLPDCMDYSGSMSPRERFLFYALLYLYHSNEDDSCGWWDLKEFFNDLEMEGLQIEFQHEELELQGNGVITYAAEDGIMQKDKFKISDSIKEEIYSDCGGLRIKAPISGILKYDSFAEKHLFYDFRLEKQISSLYDILSADRYPKVLETLETRGLRTGFTCLLYGNPGTGKTETVYQLARSTGRDVIMVDVSKLKSMWVGESEKNLKALFNKYRQTVNNSPITPILLFNEADAIFGIRQSGAERAVEKMENSLQNIILQEMEDLKGILIATTNLSENLDKAFERRFLYKVKFENPSKTVKQKIWKAMMPELSDHECQCLAEQFEFNGGQIENIIRKKTVQSILSGQEPSFEDIQTLCREEMIYSRTSIRKIGF